MVPYLSRNEQRMHYDPANPLIVQGDRSILVEVDNPRYAAARDALRPREVTRLVPRKVDCDFADIIAGGG